MSDRWYEKAVIYCLDIDTFADSNGDGVGDLKGLMGRLDYLARLGVNTIWLNPIHPTPDRDDGYDVSDFYNVDQRFGNLGDFAEMVHQASNRGIRVIIDLVVNHTSDQHPWFQSARSSPDSPYRDWYVWADEAPDDRHQGMVFPGEQAETWSYDRTAKKWFYHRFYKFQPDLNIENPEVREEIKKICAFWLQLGVSGFRMDAVPFIIEQTQPGNPNSPKDLEFLSDLRQHIQWRHGDAVLLAEANVEPDQLKDFFGDAGGSSNRIHMLFDFMLNGRLMLALARGNPEGIIDALQDTPKLPDGGQWATFLRNHDEVDLSRLTAEQRAEVFAQFGPDENMQLYGRGIRRRLAPMLGGDRKRIELAYALQFSLRGTPVIRYGEEIGMGEDLSLDGRNAIRTPMQWSQLPNAGFSPAKPADLVRPVISGGDYGFETLNVTAQRHDTKSLLSWFERMIRTLRETPEVGSGTCKHVDVKVPSGVLVHRA
ncbi:MAG: alpha-amylase family protein, partial [Actinoplanes sp.]